MVPAGGHKCETQESARGPARHYDDVVGGRPGRAREALWAVLATVVLVIRILATIALVLFVIGWAVAAIRDSLDNVFLWPSIGAGVALLVSTYVYGHLRARYPRHNGWIP